MVRTNLRLWYLAFRKVVAGIPQSGTLVCSLFDLFLSSNIKNQSSVSIFRNFHIQAAMQCIYMPYTIFCRVYVCMCACRCLTVIWQLHLSPFERNCVSVNLIKWNGKTRKAFHIIVPSLTIRQVENDALGVKLRLNSKRQMAIRIFVSSLRNLHCHRLSIRSWVHFMGWRD